MNQRFDRMSYGMGNADVKKRLIPDADTMKWLWKGMKGQLPALIFLSLLAMLSSASYLIPAFLSRNVINAATSSTLNMAAKKAEIVKGGICLILFVLFMLGVSMLQNYMRTRITGKLEIRFRRSFFEVVTAKEYAKISKHHSGDLLNRFSGDVDVVVSGLVDLIPRALSVVTKIVAGVIALSRFSPFITLIAIGVGLIALCWSLIFKPFFKKLHKEVQKANGEVKSFTQECFENLVVVKTFSSRKPLMQKLGERMDKVYGLKIKRNVVHNATMGMTSFIFSAAYYATLVWGAVSIAGGMMDYGTLTAFLQIVSNVTQPFSNASNLITQYYSAQASAERIMELENYPDEETSDMDAEKVYGSIRSFNAEKLFFGYIPEKTIIHDTDFVIPKGSTVIMTGLSGTGKSTLFKLLLGLYPQNSGELYAVTDSGRMPINAAARPLFAYVPQGNFLLSGSIADNIKFGNPTLSDEEMIKASKIACAYDFIAALPDGFDTQLGERGAGLSEGQLQRIAVARALCDNAPVLLFDECTSALDIATEEQMLKNIAALRTKTVFFISHKNAAFEVCDVHLRMEDGVFRVMSERTENI